MLESQREEKEGKLQMLLSPRKDCGTPFLKEVRVSKGQDHLSQTELYAVQNWSLEVP